MIEIVEVCYVFSGKNLSVDALGICTFEGDVDRLFFVKADIGKGNDNLTILGLGCRIGQQGQVAIAISLLSIHRGEILVAHLHGVAGYCHGQIGGILERSVHLENIVGWGEYHVACAFLVGKNHGLQYVDNLCDIRHLHTVGMTMENVEGERSHKSVAQGILLIEVTGDGTRFFVPPGAPFVNHKIYSMVGVFLIHDSFVLLDDLFYLQTFAECPVVLVVVELDSRTLRTIPTCRGIVVERYAVHAFADAIHQYAGPFVVAVGSTTSDAVEVVAWLVAQVGIEFTEFV